MILLGFLGGTLAVAGGYSILSDLFLRDRARVGKRVDEEFRKRQRDRVRKSALFKDLSTLAAEAAADAEGRPTLRQRLEAMVEQSGLNITSERVLTITAAVGLALALVGLLFTRNVLVAAALALAGSCVPLVYVQVKRQARLKKLLAQLPDALDLMARVIRAGQTMSQGMQAVADEFDLPIAGEFAYCYEQQNLGLAPEIALRDLARRTGLLEIKIFVLALLVQYQTGGNLAELLEKLATVVRERFKMQGKIRTLTAEGHFQALVLLAMPPVMGVGIYILNPVYGRVLFDHPGLLLATLIAEVMGALWIRRIVNFDF
jgi:tight adherence protein B